MVTYEASAGDAPNTNFTLQTPNLKKFEEVGTFGILELALQTPFQFEE